MNSRAEAGAPAGPQRDALPHRPRPTPPIGRFVVVALLSAGVLSYVDRAALAPMINVVAEDLGTTPAGVAGALSAYSFAYAAAQLPWGIIATRVRQLTVLSISAVLTLGGAILTTVAWDLPSLVVGRIVVGVALAAIVPGVLVTIGDTMSPKERGAAAVHLATALSLALTIGTVLASLAASAGAWRVAFATVAILALPLAIVFAVASRRAAPVRRPGILASASLLARSPLAWGIIGLCVVEGTVVLGVFNFLPAALEDRGVPVAAAGLAIAVFGVAVVVFGPVARFLLARVPQPAIFLISGGVLAAGFALLIVGLSVPTVAIASALMGFSWAFGHTQTQVWMTEAVPAARPLAMAFYAIAMFGGGAIGTALGAVALVGHEFVPLFALSVVLALVFGVGAALLRWRYPLN